MKITKSKISRWNNEQKLKLKNFLLLEQKELLVNFYKNIVVGVLNFRRHTNFFQKMSEFVGRNPNQCKSKMQKYEKEAFTEVLKVPEDHYQFFELLRKLKSLKRKSQNVIEMFKKKHQFYQKRDQIIQQICSENISFKSNYFFIRYIYISIIIKRF